MYLERDRRRASESRTQDKRREGEMVSDWVRNRRKRKKKKERNKRKKKGRKKMKMKMMTSHR